MEQEQDTCLGFELSQEIESKDGSKLLVSDIEKFHDEVIALIDKYGWWTAGGVWLKRKPWDYKGKDEMQ